MQEQESAGARDTQVTHGKDHPGGSTATQPGQRHGSPAAPQLNDGLHAGTSSSTQGTTFPLSRERGRCIEQGERDCQPEAHSERGIK